MIPFNKPAWLGTELQRIAEAFNVHSHLAGGGPFGSARPSSRSNSVSEPFL